MKLQDSADCLSALQASSQGSARLLLPEQLKGSRFESKSTSLLFDGGAKCLQTARGGNRELGSLNKFAQDPSAQNAIGMRSARGSQSGSGWPEGCDLCAMVRGAGLEETKIPAGAAMVKLLRQDCSAVIHQPRAANRFVLLSAVVDRDGGSALPLCHPLGVTFSEFQVALKYHSVDKYS